MNALVLGATGHLGNAIARALLSHGLAVSAASRREHPARNLEELPVRLLTGDADRPQQLDTWVRGHEVVIDAAAPYAFHLAQQPTGRAPGRQLRDAAALRMRRLLEAVSRHDATLVYVSSFTTLPRERPLLDALQASALERLHPYFALKEQLEAQVREAAQRGLRAVIVNPTLCLGPLDLKPLRYCLIPLALRGELPATSGHVVNAIDVRDVARAVVAALAHERYGEPIPLRGHNTTVEGLVDTICRVGGVRPPRLRVPAQLSALAAFGNELLSTLGLSPVAYPSLGMLLLLEQRWEALGATQRELGVFPRPLSRTLAEAIDWYREIGTLGPLKGAARGTATASPLRLGA